MPWIPFPITDALRQAILELARKPGIRSISCPFDDFALWKGLLQEQVRRSKAMNLSPQEALRLAGPDSGVPGIALGSPITDDDDFPSGAGLTTTAPSLELWGGELHIPFEGASGGDLFILPEWHNAFPERLSRPGARLHWMVMKPCNYLLTNRDLGEHECATRTLVADCFLYTSNAPHVDFNPSHHFRTPLNGSTPGA